MKLQESGENYLETVLILEDKNGAVRSVDVANYLGVSKPSVSRAMNVLKAAGYITQESYGDIYLTEKGRERAGAVLERHHLIAEFLILSVGIDRETADRDACRIEHVISPETEEGMRRYVEQNRR
ncbi:MAG: metal-dependent transcriptional regulator [Candidatus Merdivicinus sp.]|jgi:DtxR family Mn-dependent transcriptional regulator